MCEREKTAASLYNYVSIAKLKIETGMDALIKEGLTEEVAAPLFGIMETMFKLLREKSEL